MFDGKRVCGKNNGDTFLLATRPSLDNFCPDTYSPCSTKTDADQTICYKTDADHDEVCPITDIKFVETTAVDDYTSSGYKSVLFNSTASIVFSKDAPNLPITTTKVEYQPCMDSLYFSSSPNQFYYDAEVERFGCVMEKHNMLTYDPRFTTSGLHTDLYEVQKTSTVLDRL